MRTNKSVARTVEILDLIANQRESLTITEISQMLGIPKSSTFEILYTLVDKGYLEVADKKLKSFKLGLKLYQAGVLFITKTDLHCVARPLLEDMMNKSQETVFLVVENSGNLVYLDKVEGTASGRTSATLGSTNPLYCTGVGKALLAAYNENKVKEIVALGMQRRTKYTFTNYEDLRDELEVTRDRGYAIDNRENELEVFCVAAPVYDLSGKAIAAISIASLASRMVNDSGRVKQCGQLVMDVALLISQRLGYQGSKLYE